MIDPLKQEPFSVESSPELSSDRQSSRLIQYLNANKTIHSAPNEGTIVVVDDQFVSKQSVELKMQDLGITNKLVMLSNGQEACDFFEAALSDVQSSSSKTSAK